MAGFHQAVMPLEKSHIIFFITFHPTSGDSIIRTDVPLLHFLYLQVVLLLAEEQNTAVEYIVIYQWAEEWFFFEAIRAPGRQWALSIKDNSAEVLKYWV